MLEHLLYVVMSIALVALVLSFVNSYRIGQHSKRMEQIGTDLRGDIGDLKAEVNREIGGLGGDVRAVLRTQARVENFLMSKKD